MRLRPLLTFGKLSLRTVLAANLVFLSFSVTSEIFAASASPSTSIGKAKQQAEAKGFVFESSHDEIVAKAKREGKLRALIGWDPPNHPHLIAAFKKKYPFIDVHLQEISGTDGGQRFFLELKAVFQDLALWPNLYARDNVLLGLSGAVLSRKEARQRSSAALALCGIEALAQSDWRLAQRAGLHVVVVRIQEAAIRVPAVDQAQADCPFAGALAALEDIVGGPHARVRERNRVTEEE